MTSHLNPFFVAGTALSLSGCPTTTMLDLRALRAAALQTRRTTSDNGYKDDHEDGEIFDPTGSGSHDQHNHNTHGNYQSNIQYKQGIFNTIRGTLSFN